MSDQTSNKTGTHSSAEKQSTSRHGNDPMPATRPVPGAFGKEGSDQADELGGNRRSLHHEKDERKNSGESNSIDEQE